MLPLVASCDSFLDLVPEDDITTVETVFEQRTRLLFKISRTCYSAGKLWNDGW